MRTRLNILKAALLLAAIAMLTGLVGCQPEGLVFDPQSGRWVSPLPTQISPIQTPTFEPTAPPLPALTPPPTLPPEPTRSGTPVIKATPTPLPTRPPLLLTPTPVGSPPADLSALYYVADNNGTPELRVMGIDDQGRKWTEENVATNEGGGLGGLHPSPDGKYIALETGGMRSILSIMKFSSGRTWCPFGKLEKCVGGFGGWTSDNRFLFRPHAGTQLEGAVLGGALIVNVDTGEYKPLDLSFSSDRSYWFASYISPDPDNTRLAYSVTYPENQKRIGEIWTMRVDGQDKRLIRRIEDGISFLSWSPTGKQLIYLYQSSVMPSPTDSYELWLLNSDGTGERLLARGQCCDPTWSPDGRYVAFVQVDNPALYLGDWRKPGTNIYVVDTIAGQTTQLSSFEGRRNHSPTWSPDGKFVAFVSAIPVGEPEMYSPGLVYVEVWIASVDGSQLYAVSGTARWPGVLAWLPSVSSAQEK